MLWGTWWAILPFMVYGVLYASTSDSRWHEPGHGTAFKTDWMNNVLYEIASFMVLAGIHPLAMEPCPPPQRHDHCRARPGNRRDPAAAFVHAVFEILRHQYDAAPSSASSCFIAPGGSPRRRRPSFRNRSMAKSSSGPASTSLIYASVIGLAIYTGSILPLMFIGLPALLRQSGSCSSMATPNMRALPKTCSTIGSTAARSI